MQNRAKVGTGVVALVAASSVLGLSLTRSRLEPIPKPHQFEHARVVESSRFLPQSHTILFAILFADEVDGKQKCPCPDGHEKDTPLNGIYTADRQSILIVFRHELPPFREQETWEVLLNHKWPKARWEFWQFPLAPKSAPRLLTTLDADHPNDPTPRLWLTPEGPVVSQVVAAGPEWEEEQFYRLRQ